MAFVHLHRHSEFSRLDGVGTAKQYAEQAAKLGQPALAQTDHGTLSGALHHIEACKGKVKGKKIHDAIVPITGVEAYYRPNRALAKKFKQRDAWHLCLYAKNLKGWHNLLKLVSTAYADVEDGGGFYQYPCVDMELLTRYREGLACSSACVSSWLSNLILLGDSVAVRNYIDQMTAIFGDDFWIEIMPHDFDDQRTLNLELVGIAMEKSIPLLATNDAHFPYKEWAETQKIAKMLGSATTPQQVRKAQKGVEDAERKLTELIAEYDAAEAALEMGETHGDPKVVRTLQKELDKASTKVDRQKGKIEQAKTRVEKLTTGYLTEESPNLYLCHEEEMRLWFQNFHPDIPENVVDESINNTVLFTQRTTPFMLDRTDKLPKVAESVGGEPEELLWRWIQEGMDRLIETYPESHWEKWPKQIYIDRINSEWAILKSKGVIDYMVMVADVVRWAKSYDPLPGQKGNKKPIRVGLGRGSAAGCLISYLVGIVAIDPISWGLLFERFLNPERKGLPDIDLDFDSNRRGEVKAYLAAKYGQDHVADIITHARFQPKSVLQAVSRVLDLPYTEMKAVTDTIEIRQDSEETTIEELLPLLPKLAEAKDKYPELFRHAQRLEGTVSNAGKHAAGIVIMREPVIERMALERGKKGDLVTSWSDAADFQAISDMGFVKIDALGITGLTKHDAACTFIKERHGIDVDLNSLAALRDPSDVDPDVMEGFQKGYTIGVFQFGSRGITSLIRSILPDTALDLAAANALYRPGPMKGGVTWDYAKHKHGEEAWDTWHDLLKPVLTETYGIVAYQEQVMEITKQLGGFTGAEADDMRKAMGKLYRIKGGTAAKDFMSKYEKKWFAGCRDRKIPDKVADQIWHKILEFGHYGFNKSHSASYALQAYQDMWLKIKYPMEFYAAILSHPSGGTPAEKQEFVSTAIREARVRGIEILPPDVNLSQIGWTVSGDAIRMGLLHINGLGEVGAATLIKERAFGVYTSPDDVRSRVNAKALNAAAFLALEQCGAMDCFGVRDDVSGNIMARWEKERLGMSLTVAEGSSKYADLIRDNIYTQDEVASYAAGTSVIVGGEVTKVEKKTTKKGDPFANVTLVFEMNEWRIKFWKEALNKFDDLLHEGNTIMVSGKTDEWNGFVSVVARDVTDVAVLAESQPEPATA